MVKEIIWSEKADASFGNIINYLLNNFTEKEVSRFVLKTNDKINFIKSNPKMYPVAFKRKNIYSVSFCVKQKCFINIFPEKNQLSFYCFGICIKILKN